MRNLAESYSEIISPEDYNRLMSKEHLYIAAADQFIAKIIKEAAQKNAEVVELGCGPARVLSLTAQIPYINLTGIDVDRIFLSYSREVLKNTSVQLKYGDAETYQHNKPVDIFYSQGFHHHISKGLKTENYLKNLYNQLKPGGIYILSDEFVPDYQNENEREIKLVIWYSHIIAHALHHGYDYLAQEEAKTLLDDIYEGRNIINIKTPKQIEFVLSKVEAIDNFARKKQKNSDMTGLPRSKAPRNDVEREVVIASEAWRSRKTKTENLAHEFLVNLEHHHNLSLYNDPTLDFSRHDYKICENELMHEIKNTGFQIKSFKHFGKIDSVGAMSIYILYKGNHDDQFNSTFTSVR